jgi:hypothetical protein
MPAKSFASRDSYPALRGNLARLRGATNPENGWPDWKKAQ